MPLAIRTEDLRKVYSSPPPAAALGRGIVPAGKADKKSRAEIVALAGLTLEVRPGEVFGLLGPNGAGKSTTVGILTTRIRPSGGRAWIGDRDVWAKPVAVKPLIGVVPQRQNLDFALTAREILTFHGAYFGMPAAERTERATALLARFQLTDRADQLPRGFSGGMMQRLSIARAMMHEPEVLFLDEPSAGLDPQTRLLLWEIIREYNGRGRTIVLTTHNMEEADALCQRVAIVDHGKIIALGTPQGAQELDPGRIRHPDAVPSAVGEPDGEARAPARSHRGPPRRRDRGRPLRGPRRPARPGGRHRGDGIRSGHLRRPHLRALPREPVPPPHRAEPEGLGEIVRIVSGGL